ncbi:MAG: S46 family peptidase [Pyrinomonadaceae bacterium]
MRLKINIFSSLILTFAVLLSSFSPAFAKDEGMFTPDQIAKLPLKAKGLKISPAELYNPKGVDISDAVIRISIGCTGEFISPQGLILTNHHCGLDALVAASTPQNEFGKNGYKAASMAEELSAKDYSIFITNRVEDVTAKIRKGTENLTGDAFNAAVKTNIDNLTKEEQAKVGDANAIRIQSLNSGYYYYLYETMQIKDIRVVYAPALDIGFFGGDPDNFEWSRHTGDYTFLRAYVAPDGKSAEYSPNNVPYKPKKFLTLSLNGVKENDFVMVMGYPGGTTRYRESQAVDYAEKVNFPFLYQYLQAWSDALVKVGQDDEAKRVRNQGLVANLDNSRKLYKGGVAAMKQADISMRKSDDEMKFSSWTDANPARKAKYGSVLPGLANTSGDFYKTIARDRVLRTYPGANTPIFNQVYNAVLSVQQGKTLSTEEKVKKLNEIQTALKDSDPVVERELIKFFLKATAELPADQKFAAAETLFNRFEGKERRAAEETFAESIAESKDFDTADKILALYSMSMPDLKKKYSNIVDYSLALAQQRTEITARTVKFNSEIDRLRLLYQQGMAEMKNSTPYPDANSTLRFTYGNVKGYKPREAVVYTPFSTLKGVIEKDTGEFPFDVPEKLKDLQLKKDFGRYGVGDSVPVNFLASTDIIGGNSGSPIMNAFGEQVGIVFDGNYEGLGNDIFYNPDRGRTIAVDIRYVLFLVEKYDNMGWMLKEMTIKGGAMTKRAGA